MTVSLAQMSTHRGHTFFEVFHRPVSGLCMIAGSRLIFCSKKTNSLGGPCFENPSNYRTRKAVFYIVFTTFMIEVFITLREKMIPSVGQKVVYELGAALLDYHSYIRKILISNNIHEKIY